MLQLFKKLDIKLGLTCTIIEDQGHYAHYSQRCALIPYDIFVVSRTPVILIQCSILRWLVHIWASFSLGNIRILK